MASSCPAAQPKRAACMAQGLKQRQQDIADLAANFNAVLPACQPADVQRRETEVGDAGMSQDTVAYAIDYRGSSSCRLMGYPAIAVHDAGGARQYTYATYAGSGSYVRFSGPPLPVTLSAKNPSAWFSLSSSSAAMRHPVSAVIAWLSRCRFQLRS
jgi:hypothetical protein